MEKVLLYPCTCGGKILRKNVEFKLYCESLGFFPAEVCSKCGEEVFDEATSDKIDVVAKEKGLWGVGIKSKADASGVVYGIGCKQKTC